MVQLTAKGQDEIQNIISSAVKSGRAPGLVFGATSLEKELTFAHDGLRVFGDPSGGPIDDDSIFWICSQSKMLATVAAFQLIEKGKLTLDTIAEDILPELAHPVVLDGDPHLGQTGFRPASTKITVRQLLNHSSGLDYGPDDTRIRGYYLPLAYTAKHDKLDPVRHFYDIRKGRYPAQMLKFEPGTSCAYSYGPDSVGFIVERITGQSLDEYYKQHIFEPLGIDSASFYLTPAMKKRLVALSYRETDGKISPWASQVPTMEMDPDHVHVHMTGVGLFSSMRDYLTLLRHLLQINAGIAVNPILKQESVHTFFEATLPPSAAEALDEWLEGKGHQWSTALCLNTIDTPGRRKKGSVWWFGWAGTYHFMDPETGVALVFGSQIVPMKDPEVFKVWQEVEEAFYRGIA